MLFHGNIPYSVQAKTFTDFFKVLSEDTWGLTLSLQDYFNNPSEIMEKEIDSSRRRKRKDDAADYRDL
jgi:hypothetical protein